MTTEKLGFVKVIIVIMLVFLLAGLLFSIVNLFQGKQNYNNPTYFSSYQDSGYYRIDPENILQSLDQGKKDVFVPLLEDPDHLPDLKNSIFWKQDEFLKIANALSLLVWNEPLDLAIWKVHFLYFEAGCKDNPQGFNSFTIVYYKDIGVSDWKRVYAARLIEIYPWMGVVRWAGNTNFSDSLLPGWSHLELTKYKISADDALQIAEKNGGKDARLGSQNKCRIFVSIPNRLNPLWNVEYYSKYFELNINPYTGEY